MTTKITILSLLSLIVSVTCLAQQRYDILFNMVHHNPGEPLFSTKFAQPEYLKELGYNGQVPKKEVQCGLTYDNWAEYAVPYKTEEREWIERHAADVIIQIKQVKDADIGYYPFLDFLVIPKSLLEKHKDEMVDKHGRITILRSRTQDIIKAQIEELFWRYPDLDGVTIRHGETYLHDTPFHIGGSPARSPEEHSMLINLLREEICIKRDKKVFYRTWDFGMLHTQPKLYMATMNNVEAHPNLYIMIKHVNADFNRGYPFNSTIGLGNIQQVVEISMNQAGCYGKNAHPYYLGKGVIEGWSEMPKEGKKGIKDLYSDSKIKGFWLWTWGDGWHGPYFDNELWVKLNEGVIRRFIQNPLKSEDEIFNEYAKKDLGLSDDDAQKLRKLAILSETAVYYGQDTKLFKVSEWHSRDHFFSCINLNNGVKNGLQKKALKEKRDNIKLWYEIEALAKQISLPNKLDQEFLEVSSTYGRIKYELIEQIWIIEFMLAEKEINGTPIDVENAKKAVKAYEDGWVEWRELKNKYACCPTLYVDYKSRHTSAPFQDNLNKLKSMCK